MATIKPELKTILDRYGIDPRDKNQLWDCHGTIVLYHKAYEIIAAKENIRFDPPTIIEASTEKKTVAMLVTGHMGDRSEWSIGECAPANNKNGYVYAMAEKRAKDRVIAKLVGLAAYVYSEDEAEEFKDGQRAPVEDAPKQQPKPEQKPKTFWEFDSYALTFKDHDDFVRKFVQGCEKAPTLASISKLQDDNEETIEAISEDRYKVIGAAIDTAGERIMRAAAGGKAA